MTIRNGKTEVPAEAFVREWMLSGSRDEVAARTGLSRSHCQSRASMLRKAGVPLKVMANQRTIAKRLAGLGELAGTGSEHPPGPGGDDEARERYALLERRMMEAAERGDETLADALRDAMDSIWYRMSDEDHSRLNGRGNVSLATPSSDSSASSERGEK